MALSALAALNEVDYDTIPWPRSPAVPGQGLSLVKYTYADYLRCPEKNGRKFEIIDGRVYAMASASWSHQGVVSELLVQFHAFLKGRPCRVFPDLDLRPRPLEDYSDTTVVRPDLVVVCGAGKLRKDGSGGVNGTPTLVIEVVSPSNAKHDTVRKFRVYQEAGVPEYWIVDPSQLTCDVNILRDGAYVTSRYCLYTPAEVEAQAATDEEFLAYRELAVAENGPRPAPAAPAPENLTKIPVHTLPGCVIDLEEVFGAIL